MHVTEEAAEISGWEPGLPLRVTPGPTNRWLLVRLDEVRQYRAAVQHYTDEVMFPESNKICRATIVTRC
jgi:hypothetical protein